MDENFEEMILLSIINGLLCSLMNSGTEIKELKKLLVPSPIDDHLCYGCQI